MNPIAAAIVVGALVVGGKLARGKSPNVDNGIGVAGVAIGLALLSEINKDLGRAFATLVVVAVALVHFPAIARSVGLMEKGKGIGGTARDLVS